MEETKVTDKPTRLKRLLALISAEFLIVFVLLITAIIVLAYAIKLVFYSPDSQFDNKAFTFISGFVSKGMTSFMVFISDLGRHTFLIPANLVLLVYFFFVKNKWLSLRVITIALSSVTLMLLLKNTFQRIRPDTPLIGHVSGFSFPSGHALMSVAFYGLLIYIVNHQPLKKWLKTTLTVLLILLILCIGLSRIYLRVHYASDVLAGLSVGLIWLVLALYVIKRIEKKRIVRKTLREATQAAQTNSPTKS